MSNFFVIDGTDGSGKATQVNLMVERLVADGHQVETIDFPRYENNHFGQLIRECLDGLHGDFMAIDPKIASVLYAADRFESAEKIRDWLQAGKTVVADRYVSSNMLHQGAKIADENKRTEFLNWLDKTEHEVFNIPRPDLILYLDIPYHIRKKLMQKDSVRSELDMAEVDEKHQTDTEQAAQALVASLNSWHPVSCVDNDELRTREDIHEELYKIVQTMLSKRGMSGRGEQ